MKTTIDFGDKARDSITKFEGIVVGKATFLYGCSRIQIEKAGLNKEGNADEPLWFDEQRVVLVEEKQPPISKQSKATTGGLQKDPVSTRRL